MVESSKQLTIIIKLCSWYRVTRYEIFCGYVSKYFS